MYSDSHIGKALPGSLIGVAFAIVVVLLLSTAVRGSEATIWTDALDYAPESTVTIYGASFVPSEWR